MGVLEVRGAGPQGRVLSRGRPKPGPCRQNLEVPSPLQGKCYAD